ncbi:GNAT family N-acetyltransferase [Agrobacterium larrymoorei]|uniref:GNAT family N-acetyltransferase n=1 Tax=Agrobacterium larrymoorei TaxID=160699 RepID=UPI001572F528|nr:GNAT family N-acetyltransferase [Agrobacterium larrymoorei]NTJ41170.1 GNAT family N-acetyltransferase [Agrobacterium larrymoorei]
MGDIIIVPLSEHPHQVEHLVEMLHAEWGALAAWSDQVTLSKEISARLQTGTPPLTLIALHGNRLVGSISITLNELSDYPEAGFWIGDVIVATDQRGKGIGTLMMHATIAYASTIGITELHLYTPDQEDYYRKLGWQTIGRDHANGEDNVVMRRAVR